MPMNFLKTIIQQKGANYSERESWIKITPSNSCARYLEGIYQFNTIEQTSEHWIFNDGYPTLLFFPNEKDCVSINNGGDISSLTSGWVDGGVIKNVYVNYMSNMDYLLVVRFHPHSFHQLFGLDSRFFQNRSIVNLSIIDVDGLFLNQFFAQKTIEQKIQCIESFIEKIAPQDTNKGLIDWAIRIIHEEKGQISVSNLVKKIGVNYKWLERNFSAHVGITPKEYIQLQRFASAYVCLYDNPLDLTTVAIANGYYDYNHFLKKFKDFTGKTPLEYLSIL